MGKDMREDAALHRVKHGYTTGARTLASRSIVGLARTRVTPNALTTSGVSLCLAASVLVFFEGRNEFLFYWIGAFVFVVGSVLDILDGALARAGGKTTPFGSFLDSTTDRVGEGAMLAAIALVFAREGRGPRSARRCRPRLPRRKGGRDHRRSRACALGRLAVGDLSAHRDGVADGSAADPVRPQTTGRAQVTGPSP